MGNDRDKLPNRAVSKNSWIFILHAVLEKKSHPGCLAQEPAEGDISHL